MRKRILLYLASLLLVLLPGNGAEVSACSVCQSTPSFCEVVGEADLIFTGKVVGGKKQRIERENGVKEIWDVAEIYFDVQESFVGAKKAERVTVRSGDRNGYCGMSFKRGETYLVYAFGDRKSGYVTGHCSRNGLVSDSAEDLRALKNLAKTTPGIQIFGTVTMAAASSLYDTAFQPMRDLTMEIRQLEGGKKTFEASTVGDGSYEIKNIPAGKYRIAPKLPGTVEFDTREVEVKNKGCVDVDFLIKNKMRIAGRVLDAEGEPVNEITVELIPAELNEKPRTFGGREDDLTNPKGEFSIDNIPPGLYVLSINYTTSPSEDDAFPATFYPNVAEKSQAMIFDVRLGGENIENIEFRLPPRLAARDVRGIVVRPDGTPVEDAHVGLRDAEDDLFTSDMRTDKSGEFILKGFPGRKYFISVDDYKSGNTEAAIYVSSEIFVLDENVKPFRLVLKK